MGTEKYDELITRLPEIAKAINEFTSEQVQVQAFGALVGALGITAEPEAEAGEDADADAERASEKTAAAKKATTRRRRPVKKASEDDNEGEGTPKKSTGRRGSGKGGSFLKDLDLKPSGRRSLEDLVAASHPKTQGEQVLASAYWCSHDVDISPVRIDHVFTCFRVMGWPLPSNLGNRISQTGTLKNWFTSTTSDEITLSAKGINFVEHTMLQRTDEKS
jgi:hypothetical protein